VTDFSEMTNLSRELRTALADAGEARTAQEIERLRETIEVLSDHDHCGHEH